MLFNKHPDMELINQLKNRESDLIVEKAKLRRELWDKDRIISYLLRRPYLPSGSLEMATGDEFCAKHGIKPWTNPLENGVKQ